MKVSAELLSASHILVVGDAMLDRYWFGEVSRISPEAPVPIVHARRVEERLGGAANVAANIAALGGQAMLLSVVGNDDAGVKLKALLHERGIGDCLIMDGQAKTTVKLRVMAHNQQMLRIDFEEAVPPQSTGVLQQALVETLPKVDTVIFSDYAKGSLNQVAALIALCRQANKKVLIDPKGKDFSRYRNAHFLTPNRSELEAIIGTWENEPILRQKVTALIKALSLEGILLTRSEEGMSLFLSDGGYHHIEAMAKEVYDISGAGDTAIAVFALCVSAGLPWLEAAMWANRAAGIVVGKSGTATLSLEELLHTI